MCSNGIRGVVLVGKRKNKPVTLGEALLPLLCNYTNARQSLSNLIQWCPDIRPGPVQPDNGTIRVVGHKTVLYLSGAFGLNKFTFSHCLMLTALKVMIHNVS